ncbi:proteasome inhibitor PI31 subunit [Gouania willdenowi]|uniref:Proteasome inhibitor PI31 subunit n=1 Tax=Gouania willdenowi TaxID=441366 RepID=A0A8C5E329_GOUWI|nr:proteasome inhibitor PI31 subunit [Gouania willdenowi]
MAGLEVLFHGVSSAVRAPQDAVICFVHWELIKSGLRCVGSGDQPSGAERRSELLPVDWSSNTELYTLRYKAQDSEDTMLLKAIAVDTTLIFNLMDCGTQQVSELTVNVGDYVEAEHLQTFDRVFKNKQFLSDNVRTQLLPAAPAAPAAPRKSPSEEEEERRRRRRSLEQRDPLRVPSRVPPQPQWPYPDPFAAGGADLDPFGDPGGGGMIVDPLRSGYPRPEFDPTSGFPDVLPPGAVPPGARFDPFGPIGRHRPGPDPDHLPPPGYDDMFM